MRPGNCSIDGCDGTMIVARGWCEKHYNRWKRHGDPTKRVKRRGEAIAYLNEVVLTYDGNECLTWPFTTNGKGYGWVSVEGKGYGVHYLACIAANGERPTPKHHAAHTCGNGANACCTKAHLVWKTPKENAADRIVHGTSPRGENQGSHKITEEQAKAIFALKGTMKQKDAAAIFHVNASHVGKLWRGERWSWLLS